MKIVFLFLITAILLFSNEMNRIEAIVDDISELRLNYEECKNRLKNTSEAKFQVNIKEEPEEYRKLYFNEREKNIILLEKVKKLEKNLKSSTDLLVSKESKIKNILSKNNICNDMNPFPTLIMKNEYIDSKIIRFKAKSFHLISNSAIYDSIDGKKIDEWSKKTSFTAGLKTDSWIKISGYFVDKKWRKADVDMWIELSNVIEK